MGRNCGISSGGSKHAERVLGLFNKFIPQLEGTVKVNSSKPCNEVILEYDNVVLSSIDMVVMCFHKLGIDIVLGDMHLDCLGALIVHNVESWLCISLF